MSNFDKISWPAPIKLISKENSTLLQELNPQLITRLYKRTLGIDVSDYFKDIDKLEYREDKESGIRYFYPSIVGDEYFYEHLQQFDWYYMSDKWEYSFAKRYVIGESKILEVGSGKAAFAQLIASNQYTGLEFNDKAIERARQSGIRLIKQSVEDHAKACDLYDLVVSFQVLEHVSDPAGFIRGSVECLKPSGLLVIAVPAHDGFAGAAINSILDMPPHHLTHWSATSLKKIAPMFGLELLALEHEPVAEYHKFWAKKIIVESKIRHLLGITYRHLDNRLFAMLISKAASLLSRVIPISTDGLKGHTVAAVYRKIS